MRDKIEKNVFVDLIRENCELRKKIEINQIVPFSGGCMEESSDANNRV